MTDRITRRTFLQSTAVLTALAGTACAQQSKEQRASSSEKSSTTDQPASALHAQDVLASMTLEQKVSQMIMPCFRSVEGVADTVTDLAQAPMIAEALRKHQYGGIILFGSNIEDAEQTTRFVHALQENNAQGSSEHNGTAIPYLVAADQEGGIVARISMGTRGTGSMALGAAGEKAEEYAHGTGEIFGEELAALGINLNLGPCADVITDLADQGMSSRIFSDDAELAGRMSQAFKSGMDKSGAITCFKHFPGAGDGSDDPTAITCSIDELWEHGLLSFKHVVEEGAEMVMTSATTFPAFDNTYTLADGTTVDCYPATMSPKIVGELLRQELKYEGVVITDALEMDQFFLAPETGAQLVPGERNSFESMVFIAQKCIEAGCDILLMPRDITSAEVAEWYDGYIQGIVDLVEKGTLAEERIDESVLRILSLKEKHSLLDGYINGSDVEKAVATAGEVVGSDDHHEAERLYAEKAVTLLKNEGVLPLPADAGNVVIVGRRESASSTIQYALSELEKAGIFTAGLLVNDLVSGTKTGGEDAKTKVTIGSYYHVDDDGNGSIVLSEELLSAIAKARYVVCNSTFFSGPDALQESNVLVQGVTQVSEAARAAGAKLVLLSDGIPVEAARYPEADAVVCSYMYAGFDIDPAEKSSAGNMGAINANVPAALRAMFGATGITGKIPIDVKALAQGADGLWSYTNEVAFARGSGIEL